MKKSLDNKKKPPLIKKISWQMKFCVYFGRACCANIQNVVLFKLKFLKRKRLWQ